MYDGLTGGRLLLRRDEVLQAVKGGGHPFAHHLLVFGLRRLAGAFAFDAVHQSGNKFPQSKSDSERNPKSSKAKNLSFEFCGPKERFLVFSFFKPVMISISMLSIKKKIYTKTLNQPNGLI